MSHDKEIHVQLYLNI